MPSYSEAFAQSFANAILGGAKSFNQLLFTVHPDRVLSVCRVGVAEPPFYRERLTQTQVDFLADTLPNECFERKNVCYVSRPLVREELRAVLRQSVSFNHKCDSCGEVHWSPTRKGNAKL